MERGDRPMRSIVSLLFLALLLAGCADKDRLPILVSSICSSDPNHPTVFKDPGFSVHGATRRDQIWISSTQEAGIRACGWKRPPARAKVLKEKTVKNRQPVHVTVPAAQPNVNEPPEPDVKPEPWPADPATLEATDPPPAPAKKPKPKHFWQRWQKQQKQ